jgi:eukaryotic-like serine/threonine-protein kinase
MNSDQWRSAWTILERVAELPQELQHQSISSLTDDPEVVESVLRMLSGDTGPADVPGAGERMFEGSILGKYRVGPEIGRGGMGVVHQAEDTQLRRSVAIKFLSTHLVSPKAIGRFVHEARAASALNHPNVVTVYEILQEGGLLAIVMEFVDGPTLRQAFANSADLPRLLDYAQQVARALSAAHAKNIVHRDVKPDNIMVRGDGIVKLLDFGIAGLAEAPGSIDMEPKAGVTTPAGTLRYLAPEQLQSPKVTPASDIYSFGVTLYELAAGGHPFQGRTDISVLENVERPEFPSLRRVRADVPAALSDLVTSMVSVDAAARPRASAVAEKLRVIASPARHKWWTPAAVGLAVIAGIAVWTLLRTRSENRPLSIRPLTNMSGSEVGASFDPKSEKVAFAWDGENEDNFDIYIKPLNGDKLQRITTSPAREFDPVWSPDGRTIAFLRESDNQHSDIVLYSLAERTERRIVQTNAQSFMYYRRLDWSPDGKAIVYSDQDPDSGRRTIFLASMETGEAKRLVAPAAGSFFHQPAFAPDGSRITFTWDHDGVGYPGMLPLTPAKEAAGAPERLKVRGFESKLCNHPFWTRDSRDLFFLTTKGASGAHLQKARLLSRPQQLVDATDLGALGNATLPVLSPNGKMLVFTQVARDGNIYGMDLAHPGTLVPIVATSRHEAYGAFSPDGKRIAFESDRTGDPEIWVADSDGSNAEAVTAFRGPVTGSPSWSPDSRYFAFDTRADSQPEVYVVAAERDAKPRRLTNDPAADYLPSWSPDGEIYFASNRSGEDRIWRIAAGGGPAEPVTPFLATNPMVSKDGTVLYFYTRHGLGRMRLPAGEIEEVDPAAAWRSATPSSRGIYYLRAGTRKQTELRYWDAATRKSVLITNLTGHFDAGLSISPGEQSILLHRAEVHGSDLMIVENFQ